MRFNLFPKFSDKRHDIAVIHQILCVPHRLIYLFLREDLATVPGKKAEDIELLWGQDYIVSRSRYSA